MIEGDDFHRALDFVRQLRELSTHADEWDLAVAINPRSRISLFKVLSNPMAAWDLLNTLGD